MSARGDAGLWAGVKGRVLSSILAGPSGLASNCPIHAAVVPGDPAWVVWVGLRTNDNGPKGCTVTQGVPMAAAARVDGPGLYPR
jgi:hypothetical protein